MHTLTYPTALLLLGLNSAAAALDYRYDDLGRLTQAIHPNGQTLVYEYDSAGNLRNITQTHTVLSALQGEVRDAGGVLLAGVTIEINGYLTETDDQGHWLLPGMPPGEYTLSARLTGYTFLPHTFTLDATHNGVIDLSAE